MKKLLLNALFMGIVTLSFAQPTFTEKTLTDMRQRMITNWDNYFKDEVSPDYVMQGHIGQTCDKACIADLNKNATLLEWPMEQVKIRQIGNVAIVTGIAHHVALFKKSNTKVQNNQRFTDTYEYKNGKWLWLSAHFTDIAPPAFTEQIVHDFNKKWIENPSKSMDETYLPTYVYSDRNGSVRTFEQLKKTNSTVKFLTWETSDITIKQSGTLAIATGISKYSYNVLIDNSTVNNNVRGVYVFEYKNGQWLMASTHHTNILPSINPATEEAVIRNLENLEREAFLKNDTTTLLTQLWSPQMVINAPANTISNLDNLKKRIAAGKQNYARFDRTIENIAFNDNLAIVMGEEKLEPQGLSDNAGKKLTRRFTNIWKNTSGNWRMIARQSTIIKVE